MLEIKLQGLNARQQVLADIMWSIEEWTDVERFIATLPKRERAECESIVEMMKMELVEEYRTGMNINDNPEADMVIDKIKKRS
jgi:predicted secreted Zn-dependent protease